MTFTVHTGELGQADVQQLLEQHVSAMRAFSPADACHVLPAVSLDQPSITFFSLREAGVLAGVGALKALGGKEGEVKSMRAAAAFRRCGVGKALLDAIAAEARTRDFICLRLETGTGPEFEAANRLYDSYGFVAGEPFGGYPPSSFTRFLRLDL
jgi:putative acetyltransferase